MMHVAMRRFAPAFTRNFRACHGVTWFFAGGLGLGLVLLYAISGCLQGKIMGMSLPSSEDSVGDGGSQSVGLMQKKERHGVQSKGDEDLLFRPIFVGDVQVMVHSLYVPGVQKKLLDVAWVTQLTPDRLHAIELMLMRWTGPVSAALYSRNITEDLAAISHLRHRVDFHIVLADLSPDRPYPVNSLRNVGIELARAEWFVMCDADFIPNHGMYEYLLSQLNDWNTGPRAIYVVPAFQIRAGANIDIPETKQALLAHGDNVSQVHPEEGRSGAHSITNYMFWRTATEPYEVSYVMPYEPYFVAPQSMPRYSGHFAGYGNDKTGQSYEVWRAGFKFLVLPEAFVFHLHHKASTWMRSQEGDLPWRDRLEVILEKFILDTRNTYSTMEDLKPVHTKTLPGQNCREACESAGLECYPPLAELVNNCEAMVNAFGDVCSHCYPSPNWYGHDLPSYNRKRNRCIVNGAPKEWAFMCDPSHAQSERLCPCVRAADVEEAWLDSAYIQKYFVPNYGEFVPF